MADKIIKKQIFFLLLKLILPALCQVVITYFVISQRDGRRPDYYHAQLIHGGL
jgi:hypothetical protein